MGASPGRRPHLILQHLSSIVTEETPAFGKGNLVAVLEEYVANLLGKEAALFLPTGKMAQQIALRLNADETGRKSFAAHPTAHPVNYELDGYSEVHGLEFLPLCDARNVPTRDDVEAVASKVGTVMWEMPLRELGGLLPAWADIIDQSDSARRGGARTHMDGARLWEAQTFYETSFKDIAEPFDSVYVSLYKSLESPRGAVLAGSQDFIARAFKWAIRLGGESIGNWPLAAAGLYGLKHVLPEMAEFKQQALRIAESLKLYGINTVPAPPQTPFFFVELPVPAEAAARAHAQLAQETGLELFRFLRPEPDGQRCTFEVSVGPAAMELGAEEIAEAVARVIGKAAFEPAVPSELLNS
ncbi:low specificity L-threonine aldolase [Arthrobacter sp. 18067]|uniref:threonine aldolase family protein n=1 Tax=Arthrobacter sp. 18067 TaxID=2681413 RepID=UPI00135BF381|nr:beta-eliminating lyase-related protein [Arthrobacter sp. 18067]